MFGKNCMLFSFNVCDMFALYSLYSIDSVGRFNQRKYTAAMKASKMIRRARNSENFILGLGGGNL